MTANAWANEPMNDLILVTWHVRHTSMSGGTRLPFRFRLVAVLELLNLRLYNLLDLVLMKIWTLTVFC